MPRGIYKINNNEKHQQQIEFLANFNRGKMAIIPEKFLKDYSKLVKKSEALTKKEKA
jgi:hypothetical protein